MIFLYPVKVKESKLTGTISLLDFTHIHINSYVTCIFYVLSSMLSAPFALCYHIYDICVLCTVIVPSNYVN